jgi:SAM-dependent methyltransferase
VATGFEAIADWWNERIGEYGDYFHRHFVLPALLDALGKVEGLHIVDLCCGNGSSSRSLARAGAIVTGVEISWSLIEYAHEWERRSPFGIRYIVSDATKVEALLGETFDAAAVNMALMDVAGCDALFGEIARLLKPRGRFVATLFHPCFQTPYGSGWLTSDFEYETRIARQIWRYRDAYAEEVEMPGGQPAPVTQQHRPLSWYARSLSAAELLIDALNEPLPDETFAAERPERMPYYEAAPVTLVLGARKVGSV